VPIPNPNDPTRSDAYVDIDGNVAVRGGRDAPQQDVGVVGFVQNMCVLWKGLAADKPKGWVVEAVPAGSYLKIATADGEVGATGGAASQAVSPGDHTHNSENHQHSHAHSMQAHTHSHSHGSHSHSHSHGSHSHSHSHSVSHDHGSFTSGLDNQAGQSVTSGSLTGAETPHNHDVDVPSITVTSGGDATGTTPSTDSTGTTPSTDSTVPTPTDTDIKSTFTTLQSNGGVTGPVNGGASTTTVAITPLFYGLYLIRYTGAP